MNMYALELGYPRRTGMFAPFLTQGPNDFRLGSKQKGKLSMAQVYPNYGYLLQNSQSDNAFRIYFFQTTG
jgi:hypothetical protein